MSEAPSSAQQTPQPTSDPHGQSLSPSQGPKGNNERPRLTESEKKTNHIASEQKRRMAIREGFDRLTELVPGLEGMGRSESVVLQKTLDYMKANLQEEQELRQRILALGGNLPKGPQ
ncbi:hypothetical protein BJ508DRAFT_414296 [Ascobolus immersus RN42]|uniref:BHLH domain-containing protein n=1 Tax=Ascobolus immersus RN42 TaxID=1160509 RepID=A0A3N4I7G5_ASCIM|nr:hypothetical protein BJ508DRAFT_414296 [Ascobolus immersus RN42]